MGNWQKRCENDCTGFQHQHPEIRLQALALPGVGEVAGL